MGTIIGIVCFIVFLVLLQYYDSKRRNRIERNRTNLLVGNQCNIVHPDNPNKKLSVEITNIKGDIIYISGSYATNDGNIRYLNNVPKPKNEIYPYE